MLKTVYPPKTFYRGYKYGSKIVLFNYVVFELFTFLRGSTLFVHSISYICNQCDCFMTGICKGIESLLCSSHIVSHHNYIK